MASEGRLRAVSSSEADSAHEVEETRDGGARVLLWGLGLAAILLAMLLAAQIQRNGQLGDQIDVLSAELDAERGRVADYRARMSDIRTSADGIAAQVEALRMLAADPEAASSSGEPPVDAEGL